MTNCILLGVNSMDDRDNDFDDGEQIGAGLNMEMVERAMKLALLLQANSCTRQEIFRHLAPLYRIDFAAPEDEQRLRAASRMLERDLKFLEDGLEYKLEKRRNGRRVSYRLTPGSGPRMSFLFNEREVDMLVLLYTLFADSTQYRRTDPHQPLPPPSPHNPFAEEVLQLIKKLVSALPPEQKLRFERWTRQPYVYFQLSPVANYLPCRDTIASIAHAIEQRRQIQFEYVAAQQRQPSLLHKHIDPYYIVYQDGHFYLFAYSHGDVGKFLEYRIDRIRHETLKMMPDTIGGKQPRKPIEFHFWLDSSLARSGLSQRWLTQIQEREEAYIDASGRERRRILIRATTYSEWRIIPQLLKYGDKAELVDPPALREQMKQELARMSKRYENQ
jgi:predicted DNA-binding transcriptional regulator YafY